MIAAAFLAFSCNKEGGKVNPGPTPSDGGRHADKPYVNDFVSVKKIYKIKVSPDILKCAKVEMVYKDAQGKSVKKKIETTEEVRIVETKALSKACIMTDEEKELASSVSFTPQNTIPSGQQTFTYEYSMSYEFERADGSTEQWAGVNIAPNITCDSKDDVEEDLNAMSLSCTKDITFDQSNGYFIPNNQYWRTADDGYISQATTTDGQKQEDPTTVQERRDGHDYVDLGLSVYWATCNVGARTEADYGGIYGWGDASGYHTEQMDHFYPTHSPSITDIKATRFDIAYSQWGTEWRLPTVTELGELFNRSNCDWKWTDSYRNSGVKGYIVTSKLPGYVGNYIFMPAAGKRVYETYYQEQGKCGYYWSSEINTSDKQFAWMSYFTNMDNLYAKKSHERWYGAAVRPVKQK